jgi:hypothetical protein
MNARKPESKNMWRLHVENFGRIKRADIDIAPMLIFVGPNNTGKSYLTTLLWGLLELRTSIFPLEPPSIPDYVLCRDLWISHCQNKEEWLSEEIVEALIRFYNVVIDEKKDEVLEKIFTFSGMRIGKITVNLIRNGPIKRDMPAVLPEESATDYENKIYRQLRRLINILLFDGRNKPLYLPASRTGFIISYKALTKELMESWGLEKSAKSDFPLPIIRFLQALIEVDIRKDRQLDISFNSECHSIAQCMEKEILEGEISQHPDPIPSFYYQAEKINHPLPLHVTSSLVSELSPLIIFLKAKTDIGTPLIFEEPESHLHLKAQRILAKYLVKLINHGMPIWLTTHSDTFFQQVNNLIASNEYRKGKLKELGYSEDEMIAPDDIRAYQFNVQHETGMTEVVPLKRTEAGFAAPTFNYEILSLSKESMDLESDTKRPTAPCL